MMNDVKGKTMANSKLKIKITIDSITLTKKGNKTFTLRDDGIFLIREGDFFTEYKTIYIDNTLILIQILPDTESLEVFKEILSWKYFKSWKGLKTIKERGEI